MTCRSSSSVIQGDFTGCSCFPSPSCTLFPRRRDGKVTLPNPLDLTMGIHAYRPPRREVRGHSISPRSIRAPLHDPYCCCLDCVPVEIASVSSSPATLKRSVDNYAQLSSLPEFKAFKLNHDGKLETRRRRANTDSTLERTKGKSEYMEEIRVTRRTKKQAYVRSGTHDFSIRLYSLEESKN